MKNKTLAIFGIGTYILSVLSSATDLEGDSTAPSTLIAISGIVTVAFIIMATIRLWKEAKGVSIALVSSGVILTIITVMAAQGIISLSYGSSVIILWNVTRIINFVAFFWAIVKLFKIKN